MGIKLIVCDIDGTLIDKTEVISERLSTVIDECRSHGIGFTIDSGRTREVVKDIVSKLAIKEPYVTANGACIFKEDRCIVYEGFSAEPIKQIIRESDESGLTVTLSNAYLERALRETDYVKEHRRLGNRFQKLMPYHEIDWSESFIKIMFMDEHRSGKIERIRKLLEAYKNEYWITTYSNTAVEIGPVNCNKATGLKKMASLMNVSTDEIMACGDFNNDYEMILEAGIGVAVGNACHELKAVADYVTQGENYHGVLEAIDKFCYWNK